jgi:hypothetical protein
MISSLFDQEPVQWGLRGDPYLWREMREHFVNTPLPATADDLAIFIETLFKTLTGHSISETEYFFVERFDHGGMSSGFIAPEFWREKAIPLLRKRHAEMQRST